ncbi:MAG: hypothetical protein LUH18_00775 [Oscillospiraceae bacterium]|nr:hypothetical protein [Oscillospiraceae bacterium]
MKRILSIALALTMLLSLSACASGENEPEVSENTLATEDAVTEIPDVEEEVEEASTLREDNADVIEIFASKSEYEEIIYEWETPSTPYESTGAYLYRFGGTVLIYEYASEEDAADAASRFNADATRFDYSDGTYSMVEQTPTHHLWQRGKYIIEYDSSSSELLQEFNALLGTEFAGIGSDYYYPAYASELYYVLTIAGYTVSPKYCEGTGGDYLTDIDSACMLEVSNGEIVYLFDCPDEDAAIEEASRFSADAKTYSGEDGTIEIDYDEPTHFYRYYNIIAKYSSESGELLDIISDVYGYQFAGEDYEYTPTERSYES